MGKKGRILLLEKPHGKFYVKELPIPEPKKREILVKQELCGICGTDVHIYEGRLPGIRYPIVLGHETIGRIEEIGEGVDTDFCGKPIKEGDLIYIVPALRCGKCYFCRVLHEPTLCINAKAYGFNPYPDNVEGFTGGYADYVYVNHPWSTFVKLETSLEAGVLLEPLTIGIHIGKRVRFRVGDIVAIQGAGAIGIASLIIAKESGASKTIVIGAPESRLMIAKEIGADIVININKVKDPKKRIEIVKKETYGGYGADIVIEATGVPSAIPEGLEMVRRGGTYVVVGHFTDAGKVNINPFIHINKKHVNIIGVWGCDIEHFVRGKVIVESSKYRPLLEKLISHKIPLEQVEKFIKAMSNRTYKVNGKELRKVVIASGISKVMSM